MEYYRLILSDRVKNRLKLNGLAYAYHKANISPEEFKILPKGNVTYYQYENSIEITDIIADPTLMVSPSLKKVLMMYNDDIEAKSVKAFPTDANIDVSPEYWILNVPEVDCLNKDEVEIYPNGAVKELILERNYINDEDVFKVKGTLENFVIVSLPVVESILRRKMYGVAFREVKVM